VAIQRLNHAVLYVSDVARSVAFYTDILGFRTKVDLGKAAFLQAADSTNDHDLGLFEVGPAPRAEERRVGLYHLAWEVDTLAELQRISDALTKAGALVGATDHATTKALYGKDPDGIEFEVCWLVPADLLHTVDPDAAMRLRPLDLARDIDRYGPDTQGGVGVSSPVPA
jgi:catechol-2,3-dioxygenase